MTVSDRCDCFVIERMPLTDRPAAPGPCDPAPPAVMLDCSGGMLDFDPLDFDPADFG